MEFDSLLKEQFSSHRRATPRILKIATFVSYFRRHYAAKSRQAPRYDIAKTPESHMLNLEK